MADSKRGEYAWEKRDRKKATRERDKRMRGNRDVFEVQKGIQKRGRKAKRHEPAHA